MWSHVTGAGLESMGDVPTLEYDSPSVTILAYYMYIYPHTLTYIYGYYPAYYIALKSLACSIHFCT